MIESIDNRECQYADNSVVIIFAGLHFFKVKPVIIPARLEECQYADNSVVIIFAGLHFFKVKPVIIPARLEELCDHCICNSVNL